MNQAEVEKVVADKGYQSNEVMRKLGEWKLRSYVTEPERGARKWKGNAARTSVRRMRIGVGFPERAVSACRPGEGNLWRETARISSTPVGWIGCM